MLVIDNGLTNGDLPFKIFTDSILKPHHISANPEVTNDESLDYINNDVYALTDDGELYKNLSDKRAKFKYNNCLKDTVTFTNGENPNQESMKLELPFYIHVYSKTVNIYSVHNKLTFLSLLTWGNITDKHSCSISNIRYQYKLSCYIKVPTDNDETVTKY